MNGICVKGGAPPEVQERQLAELKQFAMGHTDLRNWEKSEYKKLASIFDPLADIPLREWQDVWPPSWPASFDAISRFLGVELPLRYPTSLRKKNS